MCHKKLTHIVITTIVVVVALALAIAVSLWHQQGMPYIIFVSRFFDIMLPILAVGCALKYLLCGCCHHHHHGEGDACTCNKEEQPK